METMRSCYLVLSSGFVLQLEYTFYAPNFFRNFISVSRLVPFEFSFIFWDKPFNLCNKCEWVENDILSNGLYCLNLQYNITYNTE